MASLHSNKFLNPVRDGAVLPILHLNGYKIANPTISARISPEELEPLHRSAGAAVVEEMIRAAPADGDARCRVSRIRAIQASARGV